LKLALTIVLIFLYTILAGANAPVLRAGIMGIFILFGFLAGHERNLKQSFFFALFVLLIWSPESLLSASFQLSFVAMASLLYVLPVIEKLINPAPSVEFEEGSFIRKIFRNAFQTLLASAAVTLGMFPILIWYFNLFSVIGFLANLIAIPVCNAGIVLTFPVLALDLIWPPLARWCANFPLIFYQFELWLIQEFSEIPLGYFYLPRPAAIFMFSYYGLMSAWVISFAFPVKKWIEHTLFAGLLASTAVFIFCGGSTGARMTFFDLGKNDAAFISFTNGSKLMINSGRSFPSDQAYWTLRSFLMGSGISKIDAAIFTRIDAGSLGGLGTLKKYFRFSSIYLPGNALLTSTQGRKYLSWMDAMKKRTTSFEEGDLIRFGSCAELEVLNVPKEGLINRSKYNKLKIESNFLIKDGDFRILYLASTRPEVFESLLSEKELAFDIVFVPHHSSGISASAETFFEKASVRFIVSNVRDNITEMRTKFKAVSNSTLLFISELGAIEFYLRNSAIEYRAFGNNGSSSFFKKIKPA
jgi:competence protein ComEC